MKLPQNPPDKPGRLFDRTCPRCGSRCLNMVKTVAPLRIRSCDNCRFRWRALEINLVHADSFDVAQATLQNR